ncbi:MAG: cytochrome c [Rhodobacteraceae bacterium]|nr:cytochrome c [Paracoccaceae bacterium]
MTLSEGLALLAARWGKPTGRVVAPLLGACLLVQGAAAEPLYTGAQAARGERAFMTNCAGCHGFSMISIFGRYRNAYDYFGVAATSMPWEDAGSLPVQDYVDIIAYMMRENGFRAGEAELRPDRAVLEQILPAQPGRQ